MPDNDPKLPPHKARDELDTETVLRQELVRCKRRLGTWITRLGSVDVISVSDIGTPFDLVDRVINEVEEIRADMDKYRNDLTD